MKVATIWVAYTHQMEVPIEVIETEIHEGNFSIRYLFKLPKISFIVKLLIYQL